MSGLTAIVRSDGARVREESILSALDPLGTFDRKSCSSADDCFVTCFPNSAPSRSKRFFQGRNCIGLFSGDIVNSELIDWHDIAANLSDDRHLSSILRKLKGAFALVVYDVTAEVLYCASDSFGFQPLYFHEEEKALSVSTSVGSLLQSPGISNKWTDAWVYQYLFFNYPVDGTSIIANVKRVPAGTLGRYDKKTGKLNWARYIGHVSRGEKTIEGNAAIEKAIATFESVVPQWLDVDGRVAFGLSGGLDCRASLAALPEHLLAQIESFTYGIPGSTEVTDGKHISSALGLRHSEILLDEEFIADLPGYLLDTVYLSDAQQVVNRSNLVFVYSALARVDRPCSIIATGVSGDHLFRDHCTAWGNVPYLISADMASMFRVGRRRVDREFYSEAVGKRFDEFEAHIESSLDSLTSTYGEFSDPEAYYRFLMYVAGPLYFGGQAAIANSFSTFRTPYWDRELVQLGMDVDIGTVGFSTRLAKKDKYAEAALQASIVARNLSFKGLPYLGLPIDVFARKNKAFFQLHRASRKIKSIVFRKKRIEEENWPLWYRTVLSEEVERLLGEESIIKEYVTPKFVASKIAETDIHWLGKLMTAEVALRLVDNRWSRSSLNP